MVPTAIVPLAQFPLNRSDKLDRNALPEPAWHERVQLAVAPRDPCEQLVAEIFAEQLGLDQVGIHDNFFALGGHSLLATRVIARVREAIPSDLAVRDLFERPTVALLAERLHRPLESPEASAPQALPRPSEGAWEAPASYAQQRLYFIDRLEQGGATYLMPVAFLLPEPFAGQHLAQTLTRLVARHEGLRTHFAVCAEQVVQVILPATRQHYPYIDLAGLAPARQAAAARALLAAAAHLPFPLDRAPLWRCQVLRLGQAHHLLAWNIHHIQSDGGSQELLLGELLADLRAQRQGQDPYLTPLPLQYADYAAWQHSRLSGPVLEAQRAYWKQHLADAPPLLELPADRPRPAQISYRGALQQFQLSAAATATLRDFAHQRGATPFMVALAALVALLARTCRRDDILVGTPMAHRTHREFEGILGLFLNTLVLRFRLKPDWTVDQLIAAVRRETLESFTHQDLPFDKLVEELNPERSLSYTPIFQVLFVYNQAGAASLEAAPTPFAEQSSSAKFDLTVSLTEQPHGLYGAIEYATGLFDGPTISRFKQHYLHLLQAFLDGASGPVTRLDLSDADERGILLQRFNAIAAPEAGPTLVHQCFLAAAAAAGDQPALWLPGPRDSAERALTYRDLAVQVNALAHHLRALGVGPETPVALCAPRDAQLIVGLLAVLVAGGTYVPTDPAYPAARLAYTLDDAGIAIVLAGPACLPAELSSGRQVVALDQPQTWAERPSDAPTVVVQPDQLSHIIYTSGSTGQPKGVAVRHAATCARFDWMRQAFAPELLAGVLGATSICFDLSVFELLGTLCAGGQVILAENALHYPEHPARARVRLLNTVPSAARQLLEADALTAPLTVNLAGEALPADLIAALQDRGLTVNNLYGPSEDTTYSTWATMDRSHRQVPTIGRPLPRTRAYVTEPDLRLSPLGLIGELALGGAGLARAYFRRPALAAARFVPDPFSLEPGARLYRTGDLARWQHDGQLRFLGREDFQVKLRGFRIELGEIEAELARAPDVREAAVCVAQSPQGPYLAALIVPNEGFDETALRTRLATLLPHHLQPQSYVTAPAMPRTPNGKLDRAALQALCATHEPATAKPIAPPRTAMELAIAECFAAVLDRDVTTIGRDDDFFHLGGHSLLALALLTRIERRLGKAPALNTLFRGGSVAQLAALLARQGATTSGERVVLRAEGEGAPLYLIHPIGGNLLCYRKLVAAQPEGFPIYGFQAPGQDGTEPPLTTVPDLAARYLTHLADPTQPLRLAGWSFGGVIAQEMAHQWEHQGGCIAALTLLDSHLAPKPKRGTRDQAPLDLFARDLGAPYEKLPTQTFKTLDEVLTWAKQENILPEDLASDRAEALYAIFAANHQAWRHHTPFPTQAPTTLITATANRTPQQIKAHPHTWRPYLQGEFTHQTHPLTHEALVAGPNIIP